MKKEVQIMITKLTDCVTYDAAARHYVSADLYMNGDRFCEPVKADRTLPMGGARIIPGLVDVHTHGRAGGDFTTADEALLRRMASSYLDGGVTTVMPTLASAPMEDFKAAAIRIHAVRKNTGGARYLGMHLEGRYLNPAKRGAHAPALLAPLDANEAEGLVHLFGLPCHVTAALELDADGSFAARVTGAGATLALGHTTATYEQAMTALAHGATAFTHTFNAMLPLHHRGGGAVCAALTSGAFAELIVDGLHISPEMVRLAYRLAGPQHLTLITDSMEATGCADGEYAIAGMPVTVKDGKAVTHDGAIAGSTLNLLDGVKNLIRFAGIPAEDAIACATYNPAREIGQEANVGSLTPGAYADFLVLPPDGALNPAAVWLGGERVRGAEKPF